MLSNLKCISAIQYYLSGDIACAINNPVCKQCVRWKRKPIHMPTAKSKVFRVPQRPSVPPEEKIELVRITNNYKTYMKSVRIYLNDDLQSSVETEESLADLSNVNVDDFARCKEINDKWNAEIAKIREQRLLREKEEKFNLISKRLEEREERERKQIAEIEELVRKEKEREKLFITQDNIDEAIENALRTEVNYNYAIDEKGNIHYEKEDSTATDTSQQTQLERRV